MASHSSTQQDSEGGAIARALDGAEVVTPFSRNRTGRRPRVGEEVDLEYVGVRYSDGAGEPLKRVPSAHGDD